MSLKVKVFVKAVPSIRKKKGKINSKLTKRLIIVRA